MDSNRIKEIQQTTAYPNSTSVMGALNQVWNECEQENKHRIKELEGTIENMKAIACEKIEAINGVTSVDYPNDNETEVFKKITICENGNITTITTNCCNNKVEEWQNYCPNCGRKIVR